ncbi:MAG: PorT family protein [Bacteroidetes bacterium]|nr:PorT family protein [Bacteroidota bacterium]MBS1739863.1 PorT family protein [Bacteroidota bacterium]MBS1776950.1 PorT family protein [Bacteroidota bacterium]
MKKFFLLLLVSGSLAHLASAQYYEGETAKTDRKIDINRVRLGAYIAPTVSWMKPTSAKSDNGIFKVNSGGSKIGYTWGLMVDYFFAENYGISTGFQLNTSGGIIRASRIDQDSVIKNAVYNTDFNYTLQYLEIPFQLKLRSDELKSVGGMRVFGQLGLTGGFNIGKKATYSVDYTDANGNRETIHGDHEKMIGSFTIAPFLLQLNIGAGVEKTISDKMSLYGGIFFNNAFLPDVTNPNQYDFGYKGTFTDGNIRLNNLALRVGLFF